MSDGKVEIHITPRGQIQLKGEAASKLLAHFTGDWTLGPSTSSMLLFERSQSGQRVEISDATFLGRVLMAGVIEEGSMVDFLNFLGENRRTGVLVTVSDGYKKSIFFKEGAVRYATSTDPNERLGNVLFRYGLVDKATLKNALEDHTRKLGEKLVQMGALKITDLYRAIKIQVEEIVYSTFLLGSGNFYFYETMAAESIPSHLNLPTRSLLMEGLRRVDEMTYFRKKLPSQDVVPELVKDATVENLTPQESELLRHIDGHSSLEEIARRSRYGIFETTRIVFHLLQGGVLRIKSMQSMANETASESGNIEKLLEAYNNVFLLISAKAHGFLPKLQHDLDEFIKRFEGDLAILFAGDVMRPDLTFNSAHILENIAKIQEKEGVFSQIYKALNEIFYFLVFSSGISIDSAVETDLQNTVNHLMKH